MTMRSRFLTAEWRHLVMLNYEIPPAIVKPLVPRGVELDSWGGKHFVSIVGFFFLNTRVLGFSIPFHRDFEEINLRFYVRRRAKDGWRRGVVFIREIAPRWAVATVARVFYNEKYITCSTCSIVELPENSSTGQGRIEYGWTFQNRANIIRADFTGEPAFAAAGSEEEFITEHYWGYSGQRDGSTLEYHVEHPPWRIWRASATKFDCDVRGLYGEEFSCLAVKPTSAFVADGSAVMVHRGKRI